MFVIKLPNGNLMAPESAMDADGEVMGDAYVEVFPTDPEYARLAQEAVTEAELEERQRRWRDQSGPLRPGRHRPALTRPPVTGRAGGPSLPAARRGAGHGPRTRGTSCGLRAS